MRILFVTHTFPLAPGDATAPFVADIAQALAARGHQVDVVLPFHPDFAYPAGGGVRFFPYRYSPTDRPSPWGFGETLGGDSRVRLGLVPFLPAAMWSLRRTLRRRMAAESYDVIHAHWLIPNGWAATGAAKARRVPLVVTLHGSDVTLAERGLFRPLGRKALAAAGAVTAVSDDLRARVIALGSDPATTRTVHFGVDLDAFTPGAASAAERERLGAQPDELLVVAVGRLVEKKGFSYLIEAAGRIPSTHVAIIGDGDLRSELERTARQSDASVTFLGALDRAGVMAATAAADVVAVPSVVDAKGNVDGLPNTLLEALAAGRAVVATVIAGIPEVVEDGVNGLLVPPRDSGALVDALSAFADPELRRRLGEAARARAEAELSWGHMAAELEAAYELAGMA